MTATRQQEPGVPLEDFVHALTSQLDRAQQTMGMKARAGLPLTFAVKDVSIDLRAHVEVLDSVVCIRPAQAGELDASVLHLTLTTITKPMIEENTRPLPSGPSIKQELGGALSEDEQRRLEWAGVSTLAQLRQLQRSGGGEAALERVSSLPVDRLRVALAAAAKPRVHDVRPESTGGDGRTRIRILGANLVDGGAPDITLDGAPTRTLSARDDELVVELDGPIVGTLQIVTGAGGEVLAPLAGAAR